MIESFILNNVNDFLTKHVTSIMWAILSLPFIGMALDVISKI